MKTDFIYVTDRKSRAMFISMLLAMWGAAAFVANAANILWQGGTDSYTNVADWVGGVVPTGTNNAVNDNGTNNAVLINVGNPDWTLLDIRAGNASGAAGAFVQNGQTVSINGWLRLGLGTNSFGAYTLNGGTLNVQGGRINVGELGTGLFVINGGVINKSGDHFTVSDGGFSGSPQPSYGTVIQNGGTITSSSEIWIGQYGNGVNIGTGVYDLHSNATINANNWFAIGRSGGFGTLNMDGGVLNKNNNGNFLVGTGFSTPSGGSGVAVVNQSGGTINCQAQLLIPESSPSTGTFNLSGTGAVVGNNWIAVGRNGGTGYLNMTGGSLTKGGDNTTHLDIGASGNGTLNQTNGVITNLVSDTWLGESGTGVWNLEGGSAVLGLLEFCVNGSGVGTLNLDGGLLQVTGINSGSPGVGFSTLNFNGGTLEAGADNNNFISGLALAMVGPGGAIIDSHGHNITIPQNLQDNGGGLTKLGAGTLTLTGANSYSGNTLVNAGTLMIGTASVAPGNCTVADGAGFGVTVQSANGQFSAANVTLGNSTGATLNFDLGNFGNPTAAPLNVTGTFTVHGTVTVNIADALPQVGEFPLVQFPGGGLAGGGSFVLGSLPVGVAATLVTNVANNSIDLNITGVNQPRWDGQAGGNWDIGVTTNWVNIGTGLPTYFSDGNPVIFDDNALGTTIVNLVATVHPSNVTVNNNNLNYTFVGSGQISGTTGLTKTGTGTLSLFNNNTYTGPTVINGGTVIVTNLANGGLPSPVGASSASPTNLILNNATLTYSGAPVAADRGFTVGGTNTMIDAEGNLTLGGRVAVATNGVTFTAFTKVGPGTLAFTAPADNEFANSYAPVSNNGRAGLQVVGGTLVLDGSRGAQTNHTTYDLYVGDTPNSGASLVLTNTTLNVDGWLAVGRVNGGINNTSTVTLYNSALNVGNLSLGWDGGQPGNLSSQFLTLNGNSTLTDNGAVNLSEGVNSSMTLQINDNSVLQVRNPFYIALANSSTGAVVVAGSGQLVQTSGWFDIAQGGNSVGSLIAQDNARISLSGDFNVSDTGTNAMAAALIRDNAILTANNIWVGKQNGVTAILTITNNATVYSTNGVTMATYYDGTARVPAQAVVNLSGGSLAVNLVQGSVTAGTNNGVFNFNGGKLIAHGPYFGNFMFNLQAANVLAGGAIIDVGTNNIQITQPLLAGDAGGGGLTKLGSGTLRLNGVNTYTGATLVNAGTLDGTGTIAGPVTVASGAALAAGSGAIGTLTINNTLTLSAGSTVFMKLTPASNDEIVGLTSVSYNGALVVTNISGTPLSVGSVFKLFNAANAGTGNFASVTILPAGSGTFNPATGELTITSAGAPTLHPPIISGGNLILTGSGGTAGGSYTLLTTTNVALPVSAWTTNTIGTFDSSGAFSNSISAGASNAATFFRLRVP